MAKSFRILVAEDDPNDKMLLERAFSKAGTSVPIQFVRNGLEAIDSLQPNKPGDQSAENEIPTLLLLDLNMPGLTGFEVLEWLRLQPVSTQVLPVVLSASDQQSDVRRAHDLGAKCYLV